MTHGVDLDRVGALTKKIREVIQNDEIDVATLALAHEAFTCMVYFGLECGQLHNTHDLKRLMNGFLDKFIEGNPFPLQREFNRSLTH